jgi:hypothetical protein
MAATSSKPVTSGKGETEEFTSLSAELKRIDFTGTIWFAAAVVTTGIQAAGALAGGWRPDSLPMPAAVLWWTGSALALLGTVGFAWAGCPVLGMTMEEADWQKSKCIRWGTLFYITGTAAAWFAVLAAG